MQRESNTPQKAPRTILREKHRRVGSKLYWALDCPDDKSYSLHPTPGDRETLKRLLNQLARIAGTPKAPRVADRRTH